MKELGHDEVGVKRRKRIMWGSRAKPERRENVVPVVRIVTQKRDLASVERPARSRSVDLLSVD